MISHHLDRALRRRRKAIDLSLLSSLSPSLFSSLLSSIGGEWTLANTQTALLVVFMLACFESLIGIGLFVSGVFLLGIASYLLSQEIISSTQLAITAAGGAILGDHVGFFFGRFLGRCLGQADSCRNASSSSTHCHAQHGRERWCCWQPESIRSFSPSF